MKTFLLLAAMVALPPVPAFAAKEGTPRDSVVVQVETNRGLVPVTLVRKGSGFVGPRGEYYPEFPSKKTLAAVYGGPATKPAKPGSTPAQADASDDIKVRQVAGGVNIRRNGKPLSEIRTKYPEVRGWKLEKENTRIAIKSGMGREPGFVELFEVQTGKRLDKIKATDVKDGKPGWARHFAE